MKKRKASIAQIWKRSLSSGLACILTIAALPSLSMPVSAEKNELLKAGSINTTEEYVTQKQPFASGTAGSNYFRIPAFIVTQNGNLLAAADARYSTTGDGGGLDTIASVSKDGGQSWSYSFPLYFPDGDGYTGNNATTIIDPALVQGEDGAIYCLADVNPTGVTTMGGYTAPGAGTGYIKVNGKDRLALTSQYSNVNICPTDDNKTVYEYYVGDFDDDGFAPVINRADDSPSAYAVDRWYNLYSVRDGQYAADLTQTQVNTDTEIQQNAFYQGSDLHVYNTGYMMYAKSVDDGMTWGDPQILNPQIKRTDGESALLVSPGQGILTSDNTIVIPFYNHGDGEENASIIWSDDNGVTWSRSNDVPGQAQGGWWSSESEVVELSDGTLRMFFRSGTSAICYADAVRNADNDYEFTTPVNTGVSCTSTCNVTAISYSKEIDGKQAILVGAPGGSGRANGKIFTFLVNDNNTMTLKNTFSVPNSSGAYQYSCMSELDDGTVGLLWENGSASIVYDNFSITELVPNGYIPGISVDVELWANETYTRTYSIGSEYMTGITEQPNTDFAEVTLEKEDAVETTVIPLYSHTSNVASSLDSFSGNEDTSINIEEAEFTLNAVETEDIYTVYNESKQLYLTNASSANTFFSSDAGNMKLEAFEENGETTFRICKENGQRFVIFYYTNMDFNSNSAYNASFDTGDYQLVLLEKQDNTSEDDIIPGYKRVSEITSGEKYLISYIYENNVIILYPSNGTASQTKLTGEPRKETLSAECTVAITGKGEGITTAVVDGITYNINCKGNPKIDLVPGQTYFIEGAESYSSEDASIAAVSAGTETRKGLFDCERTADHSLEGYSTTPNWDINMAGAEFIVQKSGENYTIYNGSEEVYLVNTNAAEYFSSSEITQSLTPTEDENGMTSFEIRRVSNDDKNNRYVFFFFERMAFDAVGAKSGFETRGDFGFEFLEKQNTVTNLDPIPGYKRVSEITSGKTYLITEYYEDGIIVLYPRNGIVNQSKLYRSIDVEGAVITAVKAGAKTMVTVDGLTYEVTISAECPHSSGMVVENRKEAACEESGYTGDTKCALCGEVLAVGEEVPAIGHKWDEGRVTKPVTSTEDGVFTYTCKNDASHTKTVPISALEFVKNNLDKKLADTAELLKATDIYTEESIAVLQQAYDAAKAISEKADAALEEVNTSIELLQQACDELVTIESVKIDEAKKELAEETGKAASIVSAGNKEYTEESWKVFTDAYDKAVNADSNASLAEIEKLLQDLKMAEAGLIKRNLTLEAAKEELEAAITSAKGTFEAGQKNYTAASWKIFTDAYQSALKIPENAGLEEVTKALQMLKSAQSQLINSVAAPAIKFLKATADKSGVAVKITVNKVTGADRYAVYRIVNKKAVLVGTADSGKLTVSDRKLSSRKASYYAVAISADGRVISGNGAVKAISMAAGVKIKKVSQASKGVQIKWAKSKKANKYVIYRSNKKNGTYSRVATVSAKQTSYVDKKARKGKTYYYKIVVKTKSQVSLMSKASKKIKVKK